MVLKQYSKYKFISGGILLKSETKIYCQKNGKIYMYVVSTDTYRYEIQEQKKIRYGIPAYTGPFRKLFLRQKICTRNHHLNTFWVGAVSQQNIIHGKIYSHQPTSTNIRRLGRMGNPTQVMFEKVICHLVRDDDHLPP
jgi:hypothetical protein